MDAASCSDLLARAGARRIEHDRVEPVELRGGQRAAEQVAMIGEDLAPAPRRRRLQRQDRVARGLGGIDRAPGSASAKVPSPANRSATVPASPDRLAHRRDQRRLALARRLEEAPGGNGTGTPPSVIVTGSGSQRVSGPKPVVDREPRELVALGRRR